MKRESVVSVREQVRGLIGVVLDTDGERLPAEPSTANTPSWDSLRHLMIMMAVERDFGVTIEPDHAPSLTSVALIVDYLEKAGAAGDVFGSSGKA